MTQKIMKQECWSEILTDQHVINMSENSLTSRLERFLKNEQNGSILSQPCERLLKLDHFNILLYVDIRFDFTLVSNLNFIIWCWNNPGKQIALCKSYQGYYSRNQFVLGPLFYKKWSVVTLWYYYFSYPKLPAARYSRTNRWEVHK